ncbi:MAG: hypothetical protein K2N48_12920 [Muribaculaceae bacterium]|nr:hypothetical protein [Muribaculaceae bacterium]
MEGENERLRFECAFSEKTIRNNRLWIIIYTILVILILCLAIWSSGLTPLNIWFSLALIVFTVLLDAYSIIYVKRLSSGSYLEITSDGILKCVYKGRKEVSYPINEIISIEKSPFKDARKKRAKVPIQVDKYGDLYPSEGVLITFNRAWIKSIFPVYFNPANIEGFIYAINERIKPAGKCSKFEGKD